MSRCAASPLAAGCWCWALPAADPVLDVNRPLIKGYSVVGVRAGEYGRRFPERGREHLAAVARLAAAGVLRPTVGARFPLAEAREALAAMAARSVTGKIVVTLADG